MKRTSASTATTSHGFCSLLSQEARYALPPSVAEDMLAFVENAAIEGDFDPRQFKVNMTREDVAARLRAAYRL
jgi:hypothetical protein